jgi:hypothetical protein
MLARPVALAGIGVRVKVTPRAQDGRADTGTWPRMFEQASP